MSLTPPESATYSFALGFLSSSLPSYLIDTTFYGMHALLFGIFASTVIQKRLFSRRFLLIITVASFANGTAYMVCSGLYTFPAVVPPGQSSSQELLNIQLWLATLQTVMNDGIVLWRAWVLSRIMISGRWVLFLFVALWLGMLVLSLLAALRLPIIQYSNLAWLVLTTVVNIIAALALTYVLWAHKRFLKAFVSPARRHTPAQKVLVLCIESGTIYCILQMLLLITFVIPQKFQFTSEYVTFTNVVNETFNSVSFMYPVTVALLMHTRQSMVEECIVLSSDLSVNFGTAPDARIIPRLHLKQDRTRRD